MTRVSISIHASAATVWDALIRPEQIKKYFFGTEIETDWKPGSPIYWRGTWQGTTYEDKGKVLEIRKDRRLSFAHWSSFSGKPDLPQYYQTVTYDIRDEGEHTVVTVTQDCAGQEKDSCEANWKIVLDGLKKLIEFRGDSSRMPA